MNPSREDVGEATITLPDPQAAASQKVFFARVGMLLLMAGLLYLVWRIVTPLWQPVTWAILLGALLAPTTARLAARLGNRPRLASSLMTVAVVLLLLLPVLALGGAVAAQAAQLLNSIDTSSLRTSNLDLRGLSGAGRATHVARGNGGPVARADRGLDGHGRQAPARVRGRVGWRRVPRGTRHDHEIPADAVRAVLHAARRPPDRADAGPHAAHRDPPARQVVAAPDRRNARSVHGHRVDGAGAGDAARHRLRDRGPAFAAAVRRAGRTVRAGADRRHHHRVGTRDPLAAVAGPAPLRNLHALRGAWWSSAPWTTSCGQS